MLPYSSLILVTTITAGSGRLPSQRRFKARAETRAKGIPLTDAEMRSLERLLTEGLDAV